MPRSTARLANIFLFTACDARPATVELLEVAIRGDSRFRLKKINCIFDVPERNFFNKISDVEWNVRLVRKIEFLGSNGYELLELIRNYRNINVNY